MYEPPVPSILKTQYLHSVSERCKNDRRRREVDRNKFRRDSSSSTWQTRGTPHGIACASLFYFLSPRVRISPQIDCQIVNRGRADNFANSIPSIFARWETSFEKTGDEIGASGIFLVRGRIFEVSPELSSF